MLSQRGGGDDNAAAAGAPDGAARNSLRAAGDDGNDGDTREAASRIAATGRDSVNRVDTSGGAGRNAGAIALVALSHSRGDERTSSGVARRDADRLARREAGSSSRCGAVSGGFRNNMSDCLLSDNTSGHSGENSSERETHFA